MISRTQLRQFLAVVDTGNFTRAAHLINVTQPTLSAGIAELERQLGAILFVREKRRIRLTEAANRLVPLARAIERDFRQAERSIAAAPPQRRAIRLGVLPSIATSIIERAITRYDGDAPIELIEGSAAELRTALGAGRVDLAVTLGMQDDDGVQLWQEGYRVALPVTHRLAGLDEIIPDALADETMMARRSCEVLAATSRFFTARGIRPPFALRSANDDRVMAMVRAGLGITVAPESHATAGVRLIRLSGFDLGRSIALVPADRFGPIDNGHAIARAFLMAIS